MELILVISVMVSLFVAVIGGMLFNLSVFFDVKNRSNVVGEMVGLLRIFGLQAKGPEFKSPETKQYKNQDTEACCIWNPSVRMETHRSQEPICQSNSQNEHLWAQGETVSKHAALKWQRKTSSAHFFQGTHTAMSVHMQTHMFIYCTQTTHKHLYTHPQSILIQAHIHKPYTNT